MSTRLLIMGLGAGLLALGAGGCTTDRNARLTVGAEAMPAVFAASAPAAGDGPTTRLDRADWEPVEYRVPVDGTVHPPLWRSHASFDESPARQHGLYPTAASVLDTAGDPGEAIAAGFIEPARAVLDLAAMPVRMILEPVWTKRQSPSMYKRWHSGAWLAGPSPEAPAGDADRAEGAEG